MNILMVGPIGKKTVGGVATHSKELIDALKDHNANIEIYNIHPDKKWLGPITWFSKLYKKTIGLLIFLSCHSSEYDIVHLQISGPMGGYLPAISSSLFRKIKNIKLVVTLHYRPDYDFFLNNHKLFEFTLSEIDHLFVISDETKKIILELFQNSSESTISQIPNGYNGSLFKEKDKYKCRNQLGLPKEKDILISVGTIRRAKGYSYLIRAMKRITKKRKNIELYIVGGGKQDEIKQKIKELSLERYITLVGLKPHKEIPIWMNAGDLFVLPSLVESFGIVQIESLACGTPVVATKNPGSCQIIKSEDIGLLAEKKNPKDLAMKIDSALKKDWDTERLKKHVERNYTWENVAKQMIDEYNKQIQ